MATLQIRERFKWFRCELKQFLKYNKFKRFSMFKTDGGRRQAGVYENRVYSNYGM